MRRLNCLLVLLLGIGVGIAFYWHAQVGLVFTPVAAEQSTTATPERKVLYYRNPMGLPDTSPVPKKDTIGMDYIPVFADEPVAAEQSTTATPERKVLYYRNPMGLPDTSPVPKKDTMGMDYIPVFADEQEETGTVKVSLDKIQRIGVKTE